MKKILLSSIIIVCLIGIGIAVLPRAKNTKTAVAPTTTYVALGDSVAAGVGLETYSDSSACDRTNQSYPNLVANTLNLKLKNIACSGATLTSGILGSQDVNQLTVSSQLNQLFKQPKPYLITLTIGANDINWTTLIAKCYSGTCGTPADTSTVNLLLSNVTTNLTSTITQIQNHFGSATPHIVVTGYHQVFPSSSINCALLDNIDPSGMSWARQQQSNLDDTISSAVNQFSFVKYAAVNFNSHELCTSESWVQGINDNSPYHPNNAGQSAYAKQVVNTNKLFK